MANYVCIISSMGLDKASLRIVIGFITGHCKSRSLTGIWNRSQPDYTRMYSDAEELETIERLLCNYPVYSQGWKPLTGVSLIFWILCREPILRFSTDSLLASDDWEVLRFHQYSCVLLLCLSSLVCVMSTFLFLPFPLPLHFSYPLYYPFFIFTVFRQPILLRKSQ